MKKLLIGLVLLLMTSPVFAFGEIDRKVVVDANLADVQKIIEDTISTYEGVVTLTKKDDKEHLYTVNYNGSTYLSAVGVSNDKWSSDKYVKARMSCKLKAINDNKDVLVTCTRNSSGFNLIIFRHYKKVYQALKFEGYKVVSYKNYRAK